LRRPEENADLRISIERLRSRIEALARIGTTEQGGLSRFALTAEDMQARRLVLKWMKDTGLKVRIDNVGNIFARREGSDSEAKPIMSGSHIDTQRNAGQFDGVLGTLAALEVAATLNEKRIPTKHPIDVTVFTNEEGVRFAPSTMGSKAIVGNLSRNEIYQQRDAQGVSYLEAMKTAGLDISKLSPPSMNRGEIEAFLELHIEQARSLYDSRIPIGVVTSIVGVRAFEVRFTGRADHQALPLGLRKDALVAAAEIVLAVNQIPRNISETAVGLVGKLTAYPGMRGVVPGEVEFTIDLRDTTISGLDRLTSEVTSRISEVCERRGLRYELANVSSSEPASMSERIIKTIEEASSKLRILSMRIRSGAGHDSQNMARIADVGMIFVPSKDGRSHCPEEWAEWHDVEHGANVLLYTTLSLDKV
jgi:hydantoinase/carbamoylase family amidase